MASFVLSFFPLDVLDEIWDLIESVSEGFLTYSFLYQRVSTDFQFYILFNLSLKDKYSLLYRTHWFYDPVMQVPI